MNLSASFSFRSRILNFLNTRSSRCAMLGDMYESWADNEGMQQASQAPQFREFWKPRSKQNVLRSVRVQEVLGEAGFRSLTIQLSNLSGASVLHPDHPDHPET